MRIATAACALMLPALLAGCFDPEPPDLERYLLPETAIPPPGTLEDMQEETRGDGALLIAQSFDFGPVGFGSPSPGEREQVFLTAGWSPNGSVVTDAVASFTERLTTTDNRSIAAMCIVATRTTILVDDDVLVAVVGSWVHQPAVVAAARTQTPALEQATPEHPDCGRFPYLDTVPAGNASVRVENVKHATTWDEITFSSSDSAGMIRLNDGAWTPIDDEPTAVAEGPVREGDILTLCHEEPVWGVSLHAKGAAEPYGAGPAVTDAQPCPGTA